MIVGRRPRLRQTFRAAWHTLAALFLWDVAVTVFYYHAPFDAPALPLTIFGTVLALFLGVRVNAAYSRWWEGRILWGAMVNTSRSFGRVVLALLPSAADGLKAQLIERHIAYVHALRCQLRREAVVPAVRRVLGETDPREIARRNPANGLLDVSDQMVSGALHAGWIDTIQQAQFERLFTDMANAQGGMERLKNTPLPAQYRTLPMLFTHLFCVLLPIGLVQNLGIATPLGSAVAGFMFLAALQVGDDLTDPFGNTIHDLPLTSITTTIEVDLLQSLGREGPAIPEAVDGVLW